MALHHRDNQPPANVPVVVLVPPIVLVARDLVAGKRLL